MNQIKKKIFGMISILTILNPLNIYAMTKTETIYATCNAYGEIDKTSVDVVLKNLDKGDVIDYTNLEKIKNTNGNEKLIEGKKMVGETASQGLVYCEENCFCNYSGEIVIDLSNEYHNVQNKPTFSNGYALIIFKNDAGTNYYTIIDSTGKRTIEPQKYGTKEDKITRIESDNLQNGYFMVEDINSKKVIMDYNGKVKLSPESGETFEKFDGKYVYVTKTESSYTTKQYFKDLFF